MNCNLVINLPIQTLELQVAKVFYKMNFQWHCYQNLWEKTNTISKIFHSQIFFQLKLITLPVKFSKKSRYNLEKLNSLMQLMVYFFHRFLIYYLFLNFHAEINITSVIYPVYPTLFKLSCRNKHHICNHCVMYCIVLELYIGGGFADDCFYRNINTYKTVCKM